MKLLFDSWDITAMAIRPLVVCSGRGRPFYLSGDQVLAGIRIKDTVDVIEAGGVRGGHGSDEQVEEVAGAGAGAGAGRNVFSNGVNLVDKLLENSTTISMSFKLRVARHAFVSAVNYGFALMLMLVAMSYNCSLFLALMVGYFLGDMIFYNRTFTQRASSAYDGVSLADKDCH